LAEFIEYLKHAIPEFSISEHPLHAFSKDYFTGKLESNSILHYRAALAQIKNRLATQAPFITLGERLDYPKDFLDQDGFCHITLKELGDFFKHPAKSFLKNQLGTTLWQDEVCELPDHEPFAKPDGLQSYSLRRALVEELLALESELDEELTLELQEKALASGLFPHGKQGEVIFLQILTEADQIASQLREAQVGTEQTRQINITLPQIKVKLSGSIDRIFDETFIPYHVGSNRFKHQWQQSLSYLALLQVEPRAKLQYISLNDGCLSPSKTPSAESVTQSLTTLIQLYLEGLKAPLPFFNECFNAYAKTRLKKDHEVALGTAQKEWYPKDFGTYPSESQDEINQLCFGKDFPLESASPIFAQIHSIYRGLWNPEIKS
jgi:exonuclease V gamma subunit